MINIDQLKFDDKGLIPAIVVDAVTKQVLTLAYMNRESLAIATEKTKSTFALYFTIKCSFGFPLEQCTGRRTAEPTGESDNQGRTCSR